MEVVRVFNNELSSLYEVKPPISKAKMTQITKSAIKGIKFYKHVVQSVEKFIQKCRPEYKVPGLYVVDSIVRQSRHQFGADKDVFGPRFLKNIKITFQYLYKCAEEDRSRIVRVLNLWQKNAVFPSDVIQPLMDMAHPNTTAESPPQSEPVANSKLKSSEHSPWKGWPQGAEEPAPENRQYAEMSKQNLEKFTKGEVSNFTAEDESPRSSQVKAHLPKNTEAKPQEENAVKFNKKLLDFDYGDEEDEEETKHDDSQLSNQPNALALSMAQNLLSNPELLRQLQQMQHSIQSEALKSELALSGSNQKMEDTQLSYSSDNHNNSPHPSSQLLPPTFESRIASFQQQYMPHEPSFGPPEVDRDDRIIHLPLPPPPEPILSARDLDERSLSSIVALDRIPPPLSYSDANLMQFQYDNNAIPFPSQQQIDPSSLPMDIAFPPVPPPEQIMLPGNQIDEDERVMYSMPGEPPLPPHDFDERSLVMPTEERGRRERSRSGSQTRSRGRSGRHRSCSKSPSSSSRRRRSRSRSHSRKNRARSKERERIREKEKEREKERERRKKGIPPTKKGCVSVCSTTLWLGHVPKSCSEMDISDTFGSYGTILSIDMIPPRGCAYVVMDRRQDGHKILQKMKNLKIQGSSIKMAWAPGKGVKGKEYKDYWEVELGVSYVPYEKIHVDADVLDLLEEGGFIDEESLSENLKALRQGRDGEKLSGKDGKRDMDNSAPYEMPSQPTMVPPPMIPPTSVGLPMVLPHLMQPQFGIHLPGLLPPQAMVMPVPLGIPPPNSVLMVQQQAQNLLGGQPLPVGVPQMVPRAVPPVPQALKSLKTMQSSDSSLDSPVVTSASGAGDATPTEEDGTSVSSPSVSNTVSSSMSVSSAMSMPQFSQLLNMHNVNRPMLSVPPPVSSAGTPIPFPPPHVGYGFPPPGMRHPGHGGMGPILPNSQFPWMQKSVTDVEFVNSPRSGMPHMSSQPHPMFGGLRPQFHDSSSHVSSSQTQISVKDAPNSKQDGKSSSTNNSSNRAGSPGHQDKMHHQEMVISTDDDESMDQDFARNDAPPIMGGNRFPTPSGAEFGPRGMGMQQWMRGPPGAAQGGPRFPPRGGMQQGGPPFTPRMGGPRGMGHPRPEMDFMRHPDARAHRIGPPPSRRGDDMRRHGDMEWFPGPRDFDNPPPFDRESDRWYPPPNEDRGHPPPNEDRGRSMRDGPWVVDDRHNPESRKGSIEWGNREREPERIDRSKAIEKPQGMKPPIKPKAKPKANKKDLMDDMFRLRHYVRDKNVKQTGREAQTVKLAEADLKLLDKGDNKLPQKANAKKNEEPKTESTISKEEENKPAMKPPSENMNSGLSKREKDREARKRSRWGRTLSEEREFQEQRRNELEMKFQTYEKRQQQSNLNAIAEQNGAIPTSVENTADSQLNGNVTDPVADFSMSRCVPESDPVADFSMSGCVPESDPVIDFSMSGCVPESDPVVDFSMSGCVPESDPVVDFSMSECVPESDPSSEMVLPAPSNPLNENVMQPQDDAPSDSNAKYSEPITIPETSGDPVEPVLETAENNEPTVHAPVLSES